MKVLCIRDCWDGKSRYYHRNKEYDIDPEKPYAVHFQYFENPMLRHDNYKFDEKSMQYIKYGGTPTAITGQKEQPKPEAFIDLSAQEGMKMLKAENNIHDPVGIEIEGGEEVFTDIEDGSEPAKRGRPKKT